MLSELEKYILFASVCGYGAEEQIEKRYRQYQKRYFERAYPRAMRMLDEIGDPEFREFYEKDGVNRFVGWEIDQLDFSSWSDVLMDLRQPETGVKVGMGFLIVTSCDIRMGKTDLPLCLNGTAISHFYFECPPNHAKRLHLSVGCEDGSRIELDFGGMGFAKPEI